MTKAFLDSLKGLTVPQAMALIRDAGLHTYLVPVQALTITSEAKPKTVVLWQEPENVVKQADPGDPLELEGFAYHP